MEMHDVYNQERYDPLKSAAQRNVRGCLIAEGTKDILEYLQRWIIEEMADNSKETEEMEKSKTLNSLTNRLQELHQGIDAQHWPDAVDQAKSAFDDAWTAQTLLKAAQMNLCTPVKEYLNPWAAFAMVGVLSSGDEISKAMGRINDAQLLTVQFYVKFMPTTNH